MKIIHLNSSNFLGGAARAACRIHDALCSENISSKLWVDQKNNTDWTIEGPKSKIDKVVPKLKSQFIQNTIVKFSKTQNNNIQSPSIIPSRWLKKINSSDADIIHLHWIQDEMISIKDIGKIKKPIIWTFHDMWAFCGAEHYTNDNRWQEGYTKENRSKNEGGFDLNKWTWKRKYKYWKQPIQIISPSKWLAECVQKSKLMSEWPVSIIPYPIDLNFWKEVNKKTAREILGIPQDIDLLLFGSMGGSLDYRKGFDLLKNSLKKFKKNFEFRNFELAVFGEGTKKNKTKEVDFSIRYIGKLQDDISIKLMYNAADALVITSRQDNLPNTAIEAQACGLPVIAFNIGGLPDIIEHKISGYLASAFDLDDFANGIDWVLNRKLTRNLNEQSRENALKKFSPKKIASEYIKKYQRLLS